MRLNIKKVYLSEILESFFKTLIYVAKSAEFTLAYIVLRSSSRKVFSIWLHFGLKYLFTVMNLTLESFLSSILSKIFLDSNKSSATDRVQRETDPETGRSRC